MDRRDFLKIAALAASTSVAKAADPLRVVVTGAGIVGAAIAPSADLATLPGFLPHRHGMQYVSRFHDHVPVGQKARLSAGDVILRAGRPGCCLCHHGVFLCAVLSGYIYGGQLYRLHAAVSFCCC